MTKRHLNLCFLAVIVVAPAAWVQAQHEGHQASANGSTSRPNARCAEAGRRALTLVAAADTRSAEASGRDVQGELADLQRAVSAAQAELFTCKAAVPADVMEPSSDPMVAMDHSNMNMGTLAPGGKPADPMAGMDHSKMDMATPAPSSRPAAPGAKPAVRGTKPADPMAGMDHSTMNMGTPARGARPTAAGGKPVARGAKPADPMAGMDHSKMNMGTPASGGKPPAAGAAAAAEPPSATSTGGGAGMLPVLMAERIADPACPDKVGQATAPKAVFARKVYYFCSVAARDEFRKDPAAYLKKHPR